MKKSNKRQYFNLDNNEIYEKKDDNEFEHLKKFNNFKKIKIDNQVNDLSFILNNIKIEKDLNKQINTDNNLDIDINKNVIIDTNINTNTNTNTNVDISEKINLEINKINNICLNINQTENNSSNKNKLKNKIKYIDELKLIIIFDKYFSYDSLILLVNHLVKKYGEDNIIGEKISNGEFQKIIWENICYILYPSFLFDPYILDLNYFNNYVDCRIKSLDNIHSEYECLFPSWKKTYNFDIDYNFDDMCVYHKPICKNLTKKTFEFYELVYKVYFNIIFGEIFSFILHDYEIILNPFDNKFNINIFNKWMNSFNMVIDSAKSFITNIAKSIEFEKIDELNQNDLTNLLNKLKNDFIDNFETISKNDISKLFDPLKEFFIGNINNHISWSLFSSGCLNNINKEIILLFRYKQYINILSKNKWITKFIH